MSVGQCLPLPKTLKPSFPRRVCLEAFFPYTCRPTGFLSLPSPCPQCQLDRCQSSQSELQCEVGRLLDMMAEQRKLQEQVPTVGGSQGAVQGKPVKRNL